MNITEIPVYLAAIKAGIPLSPFVLETLFRIYYGANSEDAKAVRNAYYEQTLECFADSERIYLSDRLREENGR